MKKWIPIKEMSPKELDLEKIILLFDTGEECYYLEDWPFAIVTHYRKE